LKSFQQIDYWLPALLAGALSAVAFVVFGHTPVVRALGLALSVVGVSLTLRRFGILLSVLGGLSLAFSPAFWSQTGGSENPYLTTIALLLVVAGGITLAAAWFGHRPVLGFALGIVVFAALFWAVVGTSRSLRLTTFFTAWLLYLLMDMVLTANPRPDAPPAQEPTSYDRFGALLLLVLGVLNDPLFILICPAMIVAMLLSRARLPRWYWIVVLAIVAFGLRGVAVQYLDSGWWLYPAQQAESLGIRVPFVMADGWREGARWVNLIILIVGQFTVAGLLLGVLGLSRLSRWYPVLGEVTMAAYTPYALFGLVYFGRDSAVLLLPLLMIQIIWMTYAVYTFGQWIQKSAHTVGWVATAAFSLLPLLMLVRIAGGA
jgi:hypothetical protein